MDLIDRDKLIAALIAEKDAWQNKDSPQLRIGLQVAIQIVKDQGKQAPKPDSDLPPTSSPGIGGCSTGPYVE